MSVKVVLELYGMYAYIHGNKVFLYLLNIFKRVENKQSKGEKRKEREKRKR